MIDNTADILSSLSARSLLEATDQPCLVATATDRRIVWANEAAGALFDRPAAELTDRSLLSVHPAEERKAYRRALATEGKVERLPDGSSPSVECGDGRKRVSVRTTRVDHDEGLVVRWFDVHSDGDERYADSDESTGGDGPSHADNGPPAGVASVDRPLSIGETGHTSEASWSQLDAVERRSHLFETLQELVDVGVWLYDVESESLWWSDHVFELFGRSADDESVSHPDLEEALEGFHPEDRSTVREAIEGAIEDGEPYDVVVRIVTDDGETRWVRAKAESRLVGDIDAGSTSLICGTIHDVTDRKARERKRERDRERLEVLFDESPNVIIVHDLDGNVIDVNQKHLENLGYDREEVLSMHVTEFETGTSREELEQLWREMDVGSHRKLRGHHRRKGGSTFPVEVWLNKIEIDGEERILAVSRDISERKRRERKLEQFRKAIESAGHAIFLTDREGTIEYVNPAFEEITGYAASEAVGETPSILNSGRMDERYYREQWETILAGEQWDEQIINRRRSGGTYHAHQTIAPITDGDAEDEDEGGSDGTDGGPTVTGFVSIQTDITERIEQEQQLNTLDRVLRHNLRNGLNVVNGHAEVIQADGSDDAKSHATAILESTTELLETATKGRKVTTVLLEPDRKKPIDVAAAVENTAAAVADAEPEADVIVDAPSQAVATATERIADAVTELLENAIRHTDRERPSVTVSVDVDETVRIRVADDGPGIPEMEREILDEVRSEDDLYHGSGLGLWFVYWVVRKSGGQLEFEENDPRGSIVTIKLDRARSSKGLTSG
ncbi:PAS domain-containing sensor histidine kinase [Natrialba sp. INN-245]|uniref:PAS domain-containing sensor histidine kinase n=1 Tax=Natrialba sp. INN-245 TaxID=2690967 RepID=UPI001310F848|nr:PAS domain-containing sensor histidine kinase [Natrialba sp. INN-245]MWV39508.1 PAS domain S-box protein [Natrialba sp. INN-245]